MFPRGHVLYHLHFFPYSDITRNTSAVYKMIFQNSNKALSTLRRRNLKTQLYFYAVRPTVHTNPSRKRSFSKTLFKSEEFGNAGFSFSCGPKTFRNKSFRKRWRHDNLVIFLTEYFFSITNPIWPVVVGFINFPCVVWMEDQDAPFSNSSGVLCDES